MEKIRVPASGWFYRTEDKDYSIRHISTYSDQALGELLGLVKGKSEEFGSTVRRFEIQMHRGVGIDSVDYHVAKTIQRLNVPLANGINSVLCYRNVQRKFQHRLPPAKPSADAFARAAARVLTDDQMAKIQQLMQVEQEFSCKLES